MNIDGVDEDSIIILIGSLKDDKFIVDMKWNKNMKLQTPLIMEIHRELVRAVDKVPSRLILGS